MIYFDNAATSFPKPPEVLAAQSECMRRRGGNPGRGSHRLALAAAEKIYECREEIAALFAYPYPENVIFTMNTTAALNLAIKGSVRPGDHVLISDMEHNAVWRQVYHLKQKGVISYDLFPSYAAETEGRAEKICRAIRERILPKTRVLICTHASNICSLTMPIAQIGEICRERGIFFIVDAAQSAGHLEIRPEEMGIGALCVPGHKGLYGIQGSGFLFLREGVRLEPFMQGGSGVDSLDGNMPEDPPERYEAGTLPTPAIAGLCAGIREVRRYGIEEIAAQETLVADAIRERLDALPGITVYAPSFHGSTVLFSTEKMPSERISSELDRRGICTRPGFHCAALAHRTLATPPDGAVRVSTGMYNRLSEADIFYRAMREILN